MFFLLFNSYSLSPTMYSLISLNSQEAKLLRERERERERERDRQRQEAKGSKSKKRFKHLKRFFGNFKSKRFF